MNKGLCRNPSYLHQTIKIFAFCCAFRGVCYRLSDRRCAGDLVDDGWSLGTAGEGAGLMRRLISTQVSSVRVLKHDHYAYCYRLTIIEHMPGGRAPMFL